MKENNKITQEDIKKVASMSNSEIEKKLKAILADSKNGAMKKMLSGVNIDSFKKKMQSSSKEDIEKFMKILGKLDPSVISKIKDSLNWKEWVLHECRHRKSNWDAYDGAKR